MGNEEPSLFLVFIKMISIITPSLNILKDGRRKYFERMMESVHNQSYKNIEHIFIDGASNDGTIELLNVYKDKGWINSIIIEKDAGIYKALNKWLSQANGDYINIMNTDDFFTDMNFFQTALSVLEKWGISFVHADRIIHSRLGNPPYIKKWNEKEAFFRMPFRHQTMIVQRNVFKEVGEFDERYIIASDYKFVLKLLLAGKTGYYFPKVYVSSLDGWVSSNRDKCIEEVSQIIYECYWKECNLNPEDCRNIYLRKWTIFLLIKILLNVENKKIRNSLIFSYIQRYSSFAKKFLQN